MTDKEILEAVSASFDALKNIKASSKEKSSRWLDMLVSKMKNKLPNDYHYFFRGEDKHRKDFHLNELLFDISICEVRDTLSARKHKQLKYIKKVVWQIESEFSSDSRSAIKDFSKLVCGSAPNKMFIGPLRMRWIDNSRLMEGYTDTLVDVAAACSGRVLLVLFPHPKEWKQMAYEKPRVFSYARTKKDWREIF